MQDLPTLQQLDARLEAQEYREALSGAEAWLERELLSPSDARTAHRIALRAAFYLGDKERAQRHGVAALALTQEGDDPLDIARAHNDLAVVHGADLLYERALDHLWHAVQLRERAGAEIAPSELNNLANVYMHLARFREAIGLLGRAIERYSARGEEAMGALARSNLGRAYAEAGQPESAIPVLDAALETFERLGRDGDVATTLAKLGEAHAQAGAPERARVMFVRAIALHESGHGVRFEAETRQRYGSWALEAGDLDTALEQLGRAARTFDAADGLARSGVLEPLSRALEADGRVAEALTALRRHLEAREAAERAQVEVSTRLRQLELEFGTSKDQEVARLHAAELERTNEQLRSRAAEMERLSITDALTGLANRRAFDERLQQETGRARRYDRPLVLALLDLDRFKDVNDQYGHDLGDQVLARIARLLEQGVRAGDVAARWGGEEFALLLPDTDLEAARPVLERVRIAIQNESWNQISTGLSLTASIGAAALGEVEDAPRALLRAADQRLYAAKNAGRNQTCLSSTS